MTRSLRTWCIGAIYIVRSQFYCDLRRIYPVERIYSCIECTVLYVIIDRFLVPIDFVYFIPRVGHAGHPRIKVIQKGEQGRVSRNPLLRLPAAWFCRIIIVTDIAVELYTTVNGPANDFRVTLVFPTISLSNRSTAMRSITPIYYYRLLGRILWSYDWFGRLSYFTWVEICPTKRIH